jgi:hypothetical protein
MQHKRKSIRRRFFIGGAEEDKITKKLAGNQNNSYLRSIVSSDMNIKSQKLEILQMLITTRDTVLLKEVKKMFKQSGDTSDIISVAKLASIKRGLEQIEKGQTIPHSEVRKVYEKWL